MLDDEVLGSIAAGPFELRLSTRTGAAARRLAREPAVRQRRDASLLPKRPRLFVNRTAVLEQLSAQLARADRLMLQLSGAPGTGKTTLMRQFLGDPAVTALDGAVFFGGNSGLNDILQEMFETAYESDRPFAPMGSSRTKLLGVPRLLVVVDDFRGDGFAVDHLMESAERSSFIFVTEPGRLEGLDDTVRLAGFEEADAEKLFNAVRAPSGQSAIEDAGHLAGATPLDIVRIAAVTQGAEELDPAAAQRILLASLTATDRLVLAPFVVTRGGPLDAVVAGELAGLPSPTPILESLEARGLIDFDGWRYRLRADLIDLVQVPVTSQRIMNALGVFDAKLEANPTGTELASFAQAANNTLEAAMKDQRYEDVIATGRALADNLLLAARFDRARETLEIVLDATRRARDREMEGWTLHQIGTVAFVTGDDTAQTSLSRALEVRERIADHAGAAVTRQNLALLLGVNAPVAASDELNRANVRFGPVLLGVAAGIAALVAAALFLLRPGASVPKTAHVHHPKLTAHAKAGPAAGSGLSSPLQGPVLNTDAEPAVAPPAVAEAPQPATESSAVPKAAAAVKPHVKKAAPRHSAAPIGIDSFSASPPTIATGEYAQLCFSIRNAVSARIEGIGPVSPRGAHCVTIHPDHTMVFSLVATSGAQSSRAYTTLSVTATAAKPEIPEQ